MKKLICLTALLEISTVVLAKEVKIGVKPCDATGNTSSPHTNVSVPERPIIVLPLALAAVYPQICSDTTGKLSGSLIIVKDISGKFELSASDELKELTKNLICAEKRAGFISKVVKCTKEPKNNIFKDKPSLLFELKNINSDVFNATYTAASGKQVSFSCEVLQHRPGNK